MDKLKLWNEETPDVSYGRTIWRTQFWKSRDEHYFFYLWLPWKRVVQYSNFWIVLQISLLLVLKRQLFFCYRRSCRNKNFQAEKETYHTDLFPGPGICCMVCCYSLLCPILCNTRPPCPSLYPGVCWNSCPFSQWCHPTILSSVIPFSSCHQSFPASESFLISQFFPSDDWSIGASASTPVLSMNMQCFL